MQLDTTDAIWHRWLAAANDVYNRYLATTDLDDPFSYNERASITVLISGAERANLVSLAEFCTTKRTLSPRKNGHRCDLWLYDPESESEWGFEFKQVWTNSLKGVIDGLARARENALELDEEECGTPAYGAFVRLGDLAENEGGDALKEEIYRRLANSYFIHEFQTDYPARPTLLILTLLD